MPKAFMIRKRKNSDDICSHSEDKDKTLDSEHVTLQETFGLWENKHLLFQRDFGELPQHDDGNAVLQQRESSQLDPEFLLSIARPPADSDDVAERPRQHQQQPAGCDCLLAIPTCSILAVATTSSGRVSPIPQVLSCSSFSSSPSCSSSSSSSSTVPSPTSSLSTTRTKDAKARSFSAPARSTSLATEGMRPGPSSVLRASGTTSPSSIKLLSSLTTTATMIDGRGAHRCFPQAASSFGRAFNSLADLETPQIGMFGSARPLPVCRSPCCLPTAPASPCPMVPTPPCLLPLPPMFSLPGLPSHSFHWPLSHSVYRLVDVPRRLPVAHRRAVGVCGVITPQEVPSPPESMVSDMSSSPLLGLRSPGPDRSPALYEPIKYVDFNNNDGDNADSKVYNSSCRKEGVFDSGHSKEQNFKALLERASMYVETVNDGKGVMNPLLSPDRCRLQVDTGHVGFLRMGAVHSCPVCNVKCDTPKLLHKHVSTHKDIKRYLCSFCGKGFNDTFDLKRHTRTHTGVKPYKCDSCGKAFTQRCSLESHCRKIHGQNLPFAFNERRAKIYVCEECGHSTSSPVNHFRHLRAQHPGHPALLKHYDRRQFKFEKDREGKSKSGGVELQEESSETVWLQSPDTSEKLRA